METARSRGAVADSGPPPRRPRLDRLRSTTLARVVAAYGPSRIGNYSAGLAFNAIMSLFPLLLGILSIIGLVVSNATVESRAQAAILRAFPGQSGQELSDILTRDLHHYAGLLGIVGLLGLLWTGTNFFASLEFALSRIFGIDQRSFLRRRAMGVVMILVLAAGLLIAVGANTLMSLIPVMAALGSVVGLVALAAVTLTIYRLVPNRSFRARALWPGAVLAAVPIELITLLFPLYVRLAHGYNTYGQSLALFFLLAGWISLLSQLILIGALWNRIRLGDSFTVTGLLASRDTALPTTIEHDVAVGHSTAVGDAVSDERGTGEVTTTARPAARRLRRPAVMPPR